ncbi:MAG TPA: TIGR01777 family oxidoreductase [Blastocatellia bacterium]|nr:TIGR01777 family oxidoreductase [Blastocatellia bacterium]
MKILVTGATGLIGRSLCRRLSADGHAVVGLSRSPEKARGLAVREVLKWEPQSGPPSRQAFVGVDAVVHLAGEPIAARRWTEEQKKRIRDSRVVATRNLVNGLRSMESKLPAFISGSAIGFYGDRGDEKLYEDSAAGRGFMSQVCQDWEAEAERASQLGVRVVQVRTGVVLSREGGALQKMLTPFNLGLGGPIGSGRQWFSWIHIDDIVGVFRHALVSAVSGPVNATAPEPVTNADFTRELARALHRPAFLPVPRFGLQAVMGEMSEVLLGSQRVIPQAILKAGYEFSYPTLAPALADLLGDGEGESGAHRKAAG